MDPLPDFLKPLERIAQPFPEDAVKEAIARQEECSPHLLAVLEWTAANMEEAVEAEDWILPDFSMFLLAQFRDTRAYDPIVRIARHPLVEDLLGDVMTEGLNTILASVSGGDPKPIQDLIEDANANEFARSSGLLALGALVLHDLLDRAQLSDYLKELYQGKLARDGSYVWTGLAMLSADFGFQNHLDWIREAFQDGQADPDVEPLPHIEKRLRTGEVPDIHLREFRLVDDAIKEMSWWACFDEEAMRRGHLITDDEIFEEDDDWDEELDEPVFAPDEPIYSYEPQKTKIGRNDPCPCGSGKKYKKCCKS